MNYGVGRGRGTRSLFHHAQPVQPLINQPNPLLAEKEKKTKNNDVAGRLSQSPRTYVRVVCVLDGHLALRYIWAARDGCCEQISPERIDLSVCVERGQRTNKYPGREEELEMNGNTAHIQDYISQKIKIFLGCLWSRGLFLSPLGRLSENSMDWCLL